MFHGDEEQHSEKDSGPGFVGIKFCQEWCV